MADTPQIIYTDDSGGNPTLNIFTNDCKIDWKFPGLEVVIRTKATGTAAQLNDGYTVDPNNGYRVVTCSTYLTGDQVSTFNGYVLPASSKSYGASYPRIVVKLDGDTSFTILIATTSVSAQFITDDKWLVKFTFVERTT